MKKERTVWCKGNFEWSSRRKTKRKKKTFCMAWEKTLQRAIQNKSKTRNERLKEDVKKSEVVNEYLAEITEKESYCPT